ncbi:uncharacterized protein LOC108676499 [Hyalella azteca]|uniref:Uncharacterized protein LOC108676499 n=1 Tax=Hyalella azteca TaxID=294128 RepID=A0A8B7P1U4_HYAAZ|nr:uncharacterized protein LOC108676499 [Hyalella azteca]
MKTLTYAFWGCIAILAASLCKVMARLDDTRYITAYTGLNSTGAHYHFTGYVPDLSEMQMNDSISSACGTGIWILYDGMNYSSNPTGYFCSTPAVSKCWNYKDVCQKGSSLRYAGSPYGLNDDYYNLYEDNDFHGKEFKGNTNAADLGDLDQAVSSLIVIGQSAWTFYSGQDFTGVSVCVYTNATVTNADIELDFIILMDMLGLPDNSIRSVARGCLGELVAGAEPAVPGPRLN